MRIRSHSAPGGDSSLLAAVTLVLVAWTSSLAAERNPTRLPQGVLPTIGLWCFTDQEFQPGGYRDSLVILGRHANYNLLTTTILAPNREVTDKAVHDQIKEGALHARRLGMEIAMDLDVRLARAAFQKAHPDELQEMLRLREIALSDAGEAVVKIASEHLSDHYTFRATPYVALAGRLVRVYSYLRGPEGIEPESLQDITAGCAVKMAGPKEVVVAVRRRATGRGRLADLDGGVRPEAFPCGARRNHARQTDRHRTVARCRWQLAWGVAGLARSDPGPVAGAHPRLAPPVRAATVTIARARRAVDRALD